MIDLFYITNNIFEAKIVDRLGVDWIFIDLEKIGKKERQIGRDTVLSSHSVSDIRKIKKHLNYSKILVRCNPIWNNSAKEIEELNSIEGINMVMLPYFKKVNEVEEFLNYLDTSKIEPALLIETIEAVENLDKILKLFPFKYVHIGLNDLHIQRGTKSMFEPFTDGFISEIVSILNDNNQRFGIGGIGKIGSKLIPTPNCLINEHVRLKSTGLILSRSFKGSFNLESKELFELELSKSLEKFREAEKNSRSLSEVKLLNSYQNMKLQMSKLTNVLKN